MMQAGGYYHFIVARECMAWRGRVLLHQSILSYLTQQRNYQYFYTAADKQKLTYTLAFL